MVPRVENYEQALEFLYSRVNYERMAGTSFSADDFKLDRLREFLRRLGDPHLEIPAVHVAGTKGKGSTAAMLASVLTAAGCRTGLFTSPHVSAFEERMAVDGVIPTPSQLVALVNAVLPVVADLDKAPGRLGPTYFEIATAIAWLYFREQGTRFVVLEVGMGGRLDATNLCRPEVTIITSISRDHTRQLGSRVEQIAREKAGIIKLGVPVVCGATQPGAAAVIESVALEHHAPLDQLGRDFGFAYHPPADLRNPAVSVALGSRRYDGLALPLVGEHQAHNAALVVAAIERLRSKGWAISDESLRTGLAGLRWPGRIEVLSRNPTVIVDAAHNWSAVQALLQTLDESFPARRRILVFAAARDKDFSGMLRLLLPRFDCVVLTCFQNNPRNVSTDALLREARSFSDRPVHAAADPAAAWKLACRLAGAPDLMCITGSFFIAAELRELILDEQSRVPSGLLEGITSPGNMLST